MQAAREYWPGAGQVIAKRDTANWARKHLWTQCLQDPAVDCSIAFPVQPVPAELFGNSGQYCAERVWLHLTRASVVPVFKPHWYSSMPITLDCLSMHSIGE